jgi:uncharacterized coiled-coil protein SlyX
LHIDQARAEVMDWYSWMTSSAKYQQILSLLNQIVANQAMEIKTMSAITDAVAALTTRVTAVQGTEASALTLIQGIVTQLNTALANAADADAAVTAVKALTAQLQASDDPLAAAVAANQPK